MDSSIKGVVDDIFGVIEKLGKENLSDKERDEVGEILKIVKKYSMKEMIKKKFQENNSYSVH